MLTRIILSLLLFFITTCLSAQIEGTYTRIEQSFPPSPNAASLGTYGNYTINSFTGAPDINIPLLDIQLKKFHLPISLNYQAGGIKVEDMGSWVGTGWSLNTGGSVTRTIVDRPDDYNYGAAPGTGQLWQNWYSPGYNPTATSYTNQLDPFGGTSAPNMFAQLAHLRQGGVDTEPDIFFYDLNGVSGKFFFDQGAGPTMTKPVLDPYRDIGVNYTFAGTNPNNYASYWLNSFVIKDESGNTFYFNTLETMTEMDQGGADICEGCNDDQADYTFGPFLGGSYHSTMTFNSAWYLTKIITASNDEIDYTYTTENIQYNTTPSQTARVREGLISGTDAQGCAMPTGPMDLAIDQANMTVTQPRLTSITGPNFMISFNAALARQDISNSNALTSVQLYSGTPGNYTLIKQYNLSYHWLANLSLPQISGFGPNGGDSRQHLMLDSVSLIDQNGNDLSSYQFQYNQTVPLPDRLSTSKDFWGYFCTYGCTTSFPKLYLYPDFSFNPDVDNTYYPRWSVFPMNNYTGTTFVLPGANRNTDPVGIMAGTLTQITFPTGGYTQFTFEPHSFNYNGAVITGGGLRLKQTVSYDGINHTNDVIKNYSYAGASGDSTSGVLFNLPIFAYTENAERDNFYATGPFSPDNINYYYEGLVRSDVSQTTLGGFDGINVGYQRITESQPGNGQIVRTYSTPGYFGQVSDFTSDGGCSISQSGFCDGYFQAPVPQVYDNYILCNVTNPATNTPVYIDQNNLDINTPYTFPFAPCPNYDWNRGKPLAESYYDNSGHLQKNVTYTYQLYTPGNVGPHAVIAIKKGRLLNYAMMASMDYGQSSCTYTGGIPRYDVIANYQLLGNVAKVPLQELTTEYDINGNSISTTKNYTYSFNSLLPSTTRTDRSDGSTTILNSKYVTDLNLSQSSSLSAYLGYQNMLNSHILYEPVEQYVQKNTNNTIETIQGGLNTFKPTQGVRDVSYALRTSAPLTSFTPSTLSPTALTMDTHYQPAVSFDSYDSKLNLLQQTKVYDFSRSCVWDYNGVYPVAEVQNAALSDIAYTSFEADGTGGWTVPSTSRPKAAITGNLSYNLNFSPITRSGLNSGTTYIVSYWSNTGSQVVNSSGPTTTGMTVNGWTYYEHVVSGVASVAITPGAQDGSIDELRLYPKGALMATYTYLPMVGVTTACDANSKLLYYEYDAFGRLKVIRDQEKNILKTFNYQYKEQQ